MERKRLVPDDTVHLSHIRPSPLWTLGDLMGPPAIGAKTEWLPRTGLPSTRVTTQGGLMYPTLFNMVVDNVIRTWLAITVED